MLCQLWMADTLMCLPRCGRTKSSARDIGLAGLVTCTTSFALHPESEHNKKAI